VTTLSAHCACDVSISVSSSMLGSNATGLLWAALVRLSGNPESMAKGRDQQLELEEKRGAVTTHSYRTSARDTVVLRFHACTCDKAGATEVKPTHITRVEQKSVSHLTVQFKGSAARRRLWQYI